MSIVSPSTNFIALLTDLMDYLDLQMESDPGFNTSREMRLWVQCDRALMELEGIDQDEYS